MKDCNLYHNPGAAALPPRRSVERAMADIRCDIATVIRNNVGSLDADFARLSPKDRINAFIRLAEYVLPKQRETTAHMDGSLSMQLEASIANYRALFSPSPDDPEEEDDDTEPEDPDAEEPADGTD